MLKHGIIFVGKPSIHLHELLSLALYLEAPIAVSDETSYEICSKFSELIPVFRLSEEFSMNLFISGLTHLYTNLQPDELAPFFLSHPEHKKLNIKHVVETGIKIKNVPGSVFCSTFYHTKQLVPIGCEWENLGAIGHLSFQKHKKKLIRILQTFLPSITDAKFFVSQIFSDATHTHYTKEQTLDNIEFINLAFCGFDKNLNLNVIPAHGLIDAAIEVSKGCILFTEEMSLIALNHKKPFLTPGGMNGFYADISPLLSILPKEPKNLTPLLENFFDFETIDRSEVIKQLNRKFFNKSLFSI
jgi:hypothetical protein